MAKNFLKEHGNDYPYLRKIALAYANSPMGTTMEKIASEFSISEGNVQTAIEKAITTALISYQDCINIRNKSDINQHTHYTEKLSKTKKSIVKSRAQHKYDKLLLIRRKYIIQSYSESEIRHVAKVYIKNPEMENVWITLGLSKVELNGVLKKGTILGIIKEEEFDEMRKISLAKAKSPEAVAKSFHALNQIASLRRDRKRLLDDIFFHQHQLDHFDDFVCDEDYPNSKEDLEQLIAHCQEELALFDHTVIDSL